MDEILIDEKKYISSKRAAKLTGYAKDYVGQMCREGRVKAQLVGRSWYVLESAIQDHRFGTDTAHMEEKKLHPRHKAAPEEKEKLEEDVLPSTWESPRYEAAPAGAGALPPIQESRQEKQDVSLVEESWKQWFEHVKIEESPVSDSAKVEIEQETDISDVEDVVPIARRSTKIVLPEESEEVDERPRKTRGLSRGIVRTVQVVSICIAGVTALLALIGSGYLDNYIGSFEQVSQISGISVYEK